MNTTATTASSVSAKLRRLGYNGMRSDSRRQGIRVRDGYGGRVSISIDYDSEADARHVADDMAETLQANGYHVDRNAVSPTILYVEKKQTDA